LRPCARGRVQLLRTRAATLGHIHIPGLHVREVGAGSARGPIAEIVLTVGHSTRTLDELVELLALNGVQLLVDVRSAPGSRRMPHFARASLEAAIPQRGIAYLHMAELGGRRPTEADSVNSGFRQGG